MRAFRLLPSCALLQPLPLNKQSHSVPAGNDIIAQWGLNTNRYDMGRIGFSIVILIAMTFAWRVLVRTV